MEKLKMFDLREADEFEQKLKCCQALLAGCAELVTNGINTAESYDVALSGCFFFMDYITKEFSAAMEEARCQQTADGGDDDSEKRTRFAKMVKVLADCPELLEELELAAEGIAQ